MLKWTPLYIYSISLTDVYRLREFLEVELPDHKHTHLKLWKMLPKSLSIKANWPFSQEGRGRPRDVCICPGWDKVSRCRCSGVRGMVGWQLKEDSGGLVPHRSWGQRRKRSLCPPDPESKSSAALRRRLMEQTLRSGLLGLNSGHAPCHLLDFDQET